MRELYFSIFEIVYLDLSIRNSKRCLLANLKVSERYVMRSNEWINSVSEKACICLCFTKHISFDCRNSKRQGVGNHWNDYVNWMIKKVTGQTNRTEQNNQFQVKQLAATCVCLPVELLAFESAFESFQWLERFAGDLFSIKWLHFKSLTIYSSLCGTAKLANDIQIGDFLSNLHRSRRTAGDYQVKCIAWMRTDGILFLSLSFFFLLSFSLALSIPEVFHFGDDVNLSPIHRKCSFHRLDTATLYRDVPFAIHENPTAYRLKSCRPSKKKNNNTKGHISYAIFSRQVQIKNVSSLANRKQMQPFLCCNISICRRKKNNNDEKNAGK